MLRRQTRLTAGRALEATAGVILGVAAGWPMAAQAAAAAGIVGTDIVASAAQQMQATKASQEINAVYWLYRADAIVEGFRDD